ncbi:MAG: prepilin-type N-terminal cleavage/methylation domain-containing protein, partial [Armatimonadota bacterium]|nr:prepilin-type N-terminal cleavage/methylation domain-containing protein [Armatimonadota bacterium]
MKNPRPAAARLARRPRCGGFTLVEIMIVILILGVLMNMALPSIVSARDRGQGRACVKNLNNLSMAQDQYG